MQTHSIIFDKDLIHQNAERHVFLTQENDGFKAFRYLEPTWLGRQRNSVKFNGLLFVVLEASSVFCVHAKDFSTCSRLVFAQVLYVGLAHDKRYVFAYNLTDDKNLYEAQDTREDHYSAREVYEGYVSSLWLEERHIGMDLGHYYADAEKIPCPARFDGEDTFVGYYPCPERDSSVRSRFIR